MNQIVNPEAALSNPKLESSHSHILQLMVDTLKRKGLFAVTFPLFLSGYFDGPLIRYEVRMTTAPALYIDSSLVTGSEASRWCSLILKQKKQNSAVFLSRFQYTLAQPEGDHYAVA